MKGPSDFFIVMFIAAIRRIKAIKNVFVSDIKRKDSHETKLGQ